MLPPFDHQEDSRPTILVIDDDVLSLELYTRELSSNYRVIACDRIEEAQRCVRRRHLSAVILEPAINEGEGWQLLEEIHSSSSKLPVIVCSILDERKAGLEKAADAFLVKPVPPTTLHRMIDRLFTHENEQSDR